MKYEAILFDLDGTLLPMDDKLFMKMYFGALGARVGKHGYGFDDFMKGMNDGIKAMVKNDGSRTNYDAFWDAFCAILGPEAKDLEDDINDFYVNEFPVVRPSTRENPYARRVVEQAHKLADKVILATNAMFPPCAVIERMSWVGLKPEDFDLITTYDNYSHSKPNPAYFQDIIDEMKLNGENCLMIGNDIGEDSPSMKCGCSFYLVTDCLLPREADPSAFTHGTMAELAQYLEAME